MSEIDRIFRPWLDTLLAETGHLDLFDAHTHIGQNDPDEFNQTGEELLADLDRTGARSVVFPMHEPAGYSEANDAVIADAAASDGRLVPFCRVNPLAHGVIDEARRSLDNGARGIKLHPRADSFTLAEPAVAELAALAQERNVPMLTHAGRGIPALGQDALELCAAYPGLKLILAHAAVSDLAWIWKRMPEFPNLFIDTSWWNPADFTVLFGMVPPGQILWASDSPYDQPLGSISTQLRYPMALGLGDEAIRSITGGQLARILDGDDPLDVGPPPGTDHETDPLLDRVATNLYTAVGRIFIKGDASESISLTRLACAVGEDSPAATVCTAILELLDQAEEHWEGEPDDTRRAFPEGARLMVLALAVASTPGVPIPTDPGSPPPTRDAIGA